MVNLPEQETCGMIGLIILMFVAVVMFAGVANTYDPYNQNDLDDLLK